MKRLVFAAVSALAVVLGAAPGFATTVPDRAQDEPACAHQQTSPSCRPVFEPPGTDFQHNETLVRDAG